MNYRVERIFLALKEPIRGVDHLKALDPYALARLHFDTAIDTDILGLRPLSSFAVADFVDSTPPNVEPRKWCKASAGLKTVRGLLALYRGFSEGKADRERRSLDAIQENIVALEFLESLLISADDRDIRFCLLMRDLPSSGEKGLTAPDAGKSPP